MQRISVPHVLAACLLVGCSTASTSGTPNPSNTSTSTPDGGTTADGGSPTAKRCSEATSAIYCEDFSRATTVEEIAAAAPNGEVVIKGKPSVALEGAAGDPGRTFDVLVAEADEISEGACRIRFASPSPPASRFRLITRLRIDELGPLNLLTLAVTRIDGTELALTLAVIVPGFAFRLEAAHSNTSAGLGELPVAESGRWYLVELRIEPETPRVELLVDGATLVTATAAELPPLEKSLTHGFRVEYGPRAFGPAHVVYDDVELRGD